jgi:hypothetical protein
VQSQKAQKIDLNIDYPCPCRRRGRLVPIVLTEAFGCNRCQQIFVVHDNGYVIEQLSTNYPYKQAWRWTGHQWNKAYSGLRDNYLAMGGVILSVLLISFFLSAIGLNVNPFNLAAILLVLLIPLIVWLAYRR